MKNQPKNFIAAVEDDQVSQINVIAGNLEKKGCRITQVLILSGIISGCSSGEESSLQELKIKGIKHIEEDRDVRAI